MLSMVLLSLCHSGCLRWETDSSEVTSQIRLQINMLSDTITPHLAQGLPTQGEMHVTPYCVSNESGDAEGQLYESTTLNLTNKTGSLGGPMRLGKWRMVVQSGAGTSFPFFGVSGVFEIKDNEAFI